MFWPELLHQQCAFCSIYLFIYFLKWRFPVFLCLRNSSSWTIIWLCCLFCENWNLKPSKMVYYFNPFKIINHNNWVANNSYTSLIILLTKFPSELCSWLNEITNSSMAIDFRHGHGTRGPKPDPVSPSF